MLPPKPSQQVRAMRATDQPLCPLAGTLLLLHHQPSAAATELDRWCECHLKPLL